MPQSCFSGSPLSDELLLNTKLNTDEIWQQYGCTEAGCISVAKHPFSSTDVGFPLKHLRLSIRRDEQAYDDSRGEVTVTDGKNAVATRDLGFMDPVSNRLNILGRLDDLINVSGLKVIPYEVESVIGRLPGVQESIVLKTRHRVWGMRSRPWS